LQDLREDLFEPANQALHLGSVLVHQLPTFLREKLQFPSLHRIRLHATELVGMREQQLQDEIAIAGITLGAGGVKGLTVVGDCVGVDRE
jgi:hypothetical protein